jgi:hypothetical protein
VESAHLANQFMTGPEEKMVRIGEQDLHTQVVGEVALSQALDGGLRANGHEDRRLNGSVGSVQETGAGPGVRTFGNDFE